MSHDDPRSEPPNQGGIFLLLLMSADTVFIAVHLVHELSPAITSNLYSLKTDRGYAEIFQYVKTYWIVIMLAALWWRTSERVYAVWMLLYAYILCDDAFQIHERGGIATASYWDYKSALGLRAQDFGELTIYGVFGLTFLALIFIMYLRSSRDARNASQDLALLFGMLGIFGVIIDMLDIVVDGGLANVIFGVVEDAGEMFAMSLVCWYVFNLLKRRGNMPTSLWQLTKTALTIACSGRAKAHR
jgi:hypothetical protein